MEQRKITEVHTTPTQQGFLGEGHLATVVIDGSDFSRTDPFILLMDDQLNLPGGAPVGGPHPHAGFETVTLVLEGNEKEWITGSLEVMTAGKGIIHTEESTTQTQLRILQLWLVLPPDKRWIEPFFQRLLPEAVPTQKMPDAEIRVYSGSSQGMTSPLQHQTPFTLVSFDLEQEKEIRQEIPATYNGFIYMLSGSIRVGTTRLQKGQVAWIDKPDDAGLNEIVFHSGVEGAHFVFYAGEPQQAAIVQHGPFVGDTKEDIAQLYREYRQGAMIHLNDLPDNKKIIYAATIETSTP